METATQPPPRPGVKHPGFASNPDWMHSEIVRRLTAYNDPTVNQRINDHIHAKTGFKSLDRLHFAGTKSQKLTTYAEILRSIISKNYDILLGQPPKGEVKCAVEVVVEKKVNGEQPAAKVVNEDRADEALSTLLTLLTTPGITAQVRVWVTIEQPMPLTLPKGVINEGEAFEG